MRLMYWNRNISSHISRCNKTKKNTSLGIKSKSQKPTSDQPYHQRDKCISIILMRLNSEKPNGMTFWTAAAAPPDFRVCKRNNISEMEWNGGESIWVQVQPSYTFCLYMKMGNRIFHWLRVSIYTKSRRRRKAYSPVVVRDLIYYLALIKPGDLHK